MFLLLTETTNNNSAHPTTIVNVKRPALNAWGGLVWVGLLGHGVDICVLVSGHIRHLETAHNEEWLHILRIVRACASTKDTIQAATAVKVDISKPAAASA